MALLPGSRIGKYEILQTLGAGGMGEVYRARDARLHREVAIKLMLQDVASDAEHLARFEREAQTLAALNHPNIAQIYGIEEAEGGCALVMELVEGPTLHDRIDAGLVSFDQAIAAALQLADALDYAHGLGVIHRDLKPANIKIRPDGTIKVLDFGLAKRLGGHVPGDDTGKLVTSLTQPGTVFGTPGYMAPELLRGGIADARSDIFAYGIILFELLTGKHPFQRPSIFEIAEAILNPVPPPWPDTPRPVPEPVKAMVLKAMAKDPLQRHQTIGDAKRHLLQSVGGIQPSSIGMVTGSVGMATLPPSASGQAWPSVVSSPDHSAAAAGAYGGVPSAAAIPSVAPTAPARKLAPAIIGAVVALVLAIGGFALWQYMKGSPAPALEAKHTRVTSLGNVRGIAFSPDGRTAAYVTAGTNEGRVMVRDVTGGSPIEIWKGDLVITMRWLADGSNVLVSGLQNNKPGLWLVPRFGGPARQLPMRGAYLAISPQGDQVALANRNTRGFHVGPVSGAEKSTAINMDGFAWVSGLDWGQTSNRIAILTQAEDSSYTIWSLAPDGSDKRKIRSEASLASIRWSPIDNVIYAIRARNEAAEVIRLEDKADAEPEVILTGLPWNGDDPYMREASLSTDGTRLLFLQAFAYANLWSMPLQGAATPTALTQGTSRYGRPRFSPDGQWIASSMGTPEKSAIIKLPAAGGEAVQVTAGDAADSDPAWSRDGKKIAFRSIRDGESHVWIADPDNRGINELKQAAVESQGFVALDWLADGRLVWPVPGGKRFMTRDMQSGKQEPLIDEDIGWSSDLRVSPNGQMLAAWYNRRLTINQQTVKEPYGLFLIKWPSREMKLLLLGDYYPAGFSPDNKFVYAFEMPYQDVVKIDVVTGKSQAVGTFPVGALEACDVSPDGKKLVCAVREFKSDAWLVDNFDPHAARSK